MVAIKCGLEIHTYLSLENQRKLFCDCSTTEGEPNTHICETCTAQPGAKPLLPNKEAIEKTIAISLALGCRINPIVLFQRKHYSWPDLPSGYQRTMSGSYAKAVGENGTFMGIGIEGVHLEEDPASWDPDTGLVDYNRSGRPLVEIVTKPDFRSAEQVRLWIKELVSALKALQAVDELAGIKADVNVSIEPLYHRVEVKNVHSFKAIADAIEYETRRQQQEGGHHEMQTRAWNEATGRTVFMRDKESAQDYMFIPDPDLPAVSLTPGIIEAIRSGLPELPEARAARYVSLGVNSDDAAIIAADYEVADLLDALIRAHPAKSAAQFVRTEVLRILNKEGKKLSQTALDESSISAILGLLEQKQLSDVNARKTLHAASASKIDVEGYVSKEGLRSQAHDLDALCVRFIGEFPHVVADYKAGKEQALNFIVGKIMRELKGTASAKDIKEALVRHL